MHKNKTIALAGNPNVGKSTLFNALTGMNQHTGNWPGKTVESATGTCTTSNSTYTLVDIPGTYSLMAHSEEEEIARNFICFGHPDTVVVVCSATCLERNLNLVLQTLEISSNVIVCVNLLDEAKRKGIEIDLQKISHRLGVPVIGTVARKKTTICGLLNALEESEDEKLQPITITYPAVIERALSILNPTVEEICKNNIPSRWLSLKLLEDDESLTKEVLDFLGEDITKDERLIRAKDKAKKWLVENKVTHEIYEDMIVTSLVETATDVCEGAITYTKSVYDRFDRKLDKILTSKLTGYPIMIAMLALIFWITITGANYPSAVIADVLFRFQDVLTNFFMEIGAPDWLHGILVLGMYRVLAWVVSVMLPPMAIFFPLFTLLEDAGYLPRVAYNLDRPFKKCSACGKQALTMCMGFGCNAAGVTGCRIIDSPRERLLAILTNNFVPCNGRFPTLIAILTMFFVTSAGALSSFLSAALLTLVIITGVLSTLLITKLLSKTLLKGMPSSFTLEMPPYRPPQVGKVIVRSIFDRTLFVLGRAVVVAAPAGIVIWLMANITIGNVSILNICSNFLDPFANLMGLDGVILLAFILGFPANEIVIPIIIMAYMSQGSILELDSLTEMKQLFVDNGWTYITAISTMIFSLMHWPCSTTLLTVKKETGSLKWTALAAAIPTLTGIIVCILFTTVARLFT